MNNILTINDLLPGSRYGREERKRLFTASVEVTGRCNSTCSYCHFFATRDRKEVAYDIPFTQFDAYMQFLRYWNENVDGELSYRFSGGEALVMGDKLFEFSNYGHKITGIKPFILSVGKSLDQKWVDKAKSNSVSHVFVSVENPINPDKGAPDPNKIVKKISHLHSENLPIIAGVCVVPNHNFKDLLFICDWFYNNLGYIPAIAEVNYDVYQPIKDSEWLALEDNLASVYRKYYGVTQLNLFHSVSPELNYQGSDPYIFSLDLENSYGVTKDNYKEKIFEVVGNLAGRNYPSLQCENTSCDWWEFCDNTKWYWQGDHNNSKSLKLHDYCKFKRLLNDTFYQLVVDPAHTKNELGIFSY